MTSEKIMKAMKDIKLKNTEDYDRIPQRLLNDGCELLLKPMELLFKKIYPRGNTRPVENVKDNTYK